MPDRPDFAHFLTAQEGVFAMALGELQAGTKRSHWMWFVFPQIAGLGSSAMARRFALSGLKEAQAYVAHPLLGTRLVQATEAMLEWAGKRASETILGPVDAMKFRSSMTLFEASCADRPLFGKALDAFCAGHRDPLTLAKL